MVAGPEAAIKRSDVPKIESRIIKAGDYMLYRNVLGDGTDSQLDVFRVLDSGVEFKVGGDFAAERPDRVLFVKYGERKEAATFLLEADTEVRKGKQAGAAELILTYLPKDKRDVCFRKGSKTLKSGEHLFKDSLLFSRRSRNSLKLVRANLWGVELEWDGKEKHTWIKFGKRRSYGENLLTVTITPRYGGTPGSAAFDTIYPVLE